MHADGSEAINIDYRTRITVEEVNAIRKAMGWSQDNPEQLQSALHGSAFVVAAYGEEGAIGMARLIWDGGSGASIPGVLIIPDYRNQGIENEMIIKLFDYLREKLKPGFTFQVDIKAFGYQETMYENLGFQVSASDRRGVPMHVCMENQNELT